jgi:hypothetical protein
MIDHAAFIAAGDLDTDPVDALLDERAGSRR